MKIRVVSRYEFGVKDEIVVAKDLLHLITYLRNPKYIMLIEVLDDK